MNSHIKEPKTEKENKEKREFEFSTGPIKFRIVNYPVWIIPLCFVFILILLLLKIL